MIKKLFSIKEMNFIIGSLTLLKRYRKNFKILKLITCRKQNPQNNKS